MYDRNEEDHVMPFSDLSNFDLIMENEPVRTVILDRLDNNHWLGTGAVISVQCPGFCEFDTRMNQFCPGYLRVAPVFRSPQQTRQKNSNCIGTGMA